MSKGNDSEARRLLTRYQQEEKNAKGHEDAARKRWHQTRLRQRHGDATEQQVREAEREHENAKDLRMRWGSERNRIQHELNSSQ